MMKIAIICNDRSYSWKSCQKILANLIKSYNLTGCEYKIFGYENNADQFELLQVCRDIKEYRPSVISFVDHRFLPIDLIQYFDKVGLEDIRILFHVYGDFTLNMNTWTLLFPVVKKYSFMFLTASHREKFLLLKLLDISESLIEVVPFPVDETKYFYCPNKRKEFRLSYNKKDDDISLLYTGRLTIQKNVLLLLNVFKKLEMISPSYRLFLAGTIDDVGIPYIGKKSLPGFLAHSIAKYIDNKKIIFLGDLNDENLHRAYCGCDYYISLSGHNDEDYGMSPAEAISCGLPLILSDWGGFGSFKYYFKDWVRLVSVNMQQLPVSPSARDVFSTVAFTAKSVFLCKERAVIGEMAFKELSCKAVSGKIKSILEKPCFFGEWKGLTQDGDMVRRSFSSSFDRPFYSSKGVLDLYLRVYSAYTQEIRQ